MLIAGQLWPGSLGWGKRRVGKRVSPLSDREKGEVEKGLGEVSERA